MTRRRSAGRIAVARALWYVGAGRAELRSAPLPPPAPAEARVTTLFSGISRGTERLVFQGSIASSEWDRMRAPFQDGAFPFPVKYGYCTAGIVAEGPAGLAGRAVFCLHPHQDVFVVPVDRLTPIPDGIPARRATLAANMETALNALWDGGAGPGDRILVVGAGIVGLLIAHLAARLPGAEVTVVDPAADRRTIAEAVGASFAGPDAAPGNCDIAFDTSVSAGGLQLAIDRVGREGTVVEVSWFGDRPVTLSLGGNFHSGRVRLVSSQVGMVAGSRRARWDYGRRMAAAIALLDRPELDRLVADEVAFDDLPARIGDILAPDASGLPPVVRYPGADCSSGIDNLS